MGSWSLDLETERFITSDGCKENFGRSLTAPFSYADLQAAVHPGDRAMRDEAVATAITDRIPLDVEYRLLTPSGEERWVQIRGQANYRADGTPLSIVGVSQDVTDRRRSDEHRALLANELSHRVKNSLAMIQAVVAQTLRKASSLSEAGDTLQARIQAMAAANDLLVDERWESASIRDLLHRTLAPFGVSDQGQFHLAGPDVRLIPRIAVALALSVHELATNAVKYGALSVEGGRVHLSWEVNVGPSGPPTLHFSWAEAGGPLVTPPAKTGFGTKLIERVLAHETGGSAQIEYRADGVVFTAVAPLPDNGD
jgi:two-component sensor histidine kinase